MGVLCVDHPDILEFINAKLDGRTLQNFNLSVGVTEAFMQAVREDGRFALKHPGTRRSVDTLAARQIFDAIVEAAWRTGDPGLLFLDAINRANPTPRLGEIEATNPCGEIPLLPYEACNLGSINLARMLRGHDEKTEMDWEKLAATVRKAVRFLDNVVDVNNYPAPEIEAMCRGNRKIGLGIMGFAETLIRVGISYDSADAVVFADRLMKFISDEALKASEELAEQRGVFPNWAGSVYEAQGLRVRHATRTAIAPTGTIGIIADTTPGVEPLFALAYRRTHVLDGQVLLEVNPLFLACLKWRGLDAKALAQGILEYGNLSALISAPSGIKPLFVTALEISPEQHLQIQAAFQRYVDNSVSKTINLPHEATREDIAHAYQRAWELGLKGITIYRYGSKSSQVLELGADEKPLHYDHASRCDQEECRV
jgi:ribonucleoside-diphosphate reductase alpha chain